MTELLSSQQMRDLETSAINSGAVTGLELMERAGQGVVDAMLDFLPKLPENSPRAMVLCGPGNNGGDGFVIARLLAERGWSVDVHLFGDPSKLPTDARTNHDHWRAHNVVHPWSAGEIIGGDRPDVIIDAVFGIGLTRPLPDDIARVFAGFTAERRNPAAQVYIIAVDCPSGLNLDTGYIPVRANESATEDAPPQDNPNRADLTVTFHTPKPGHYLAMGPDICRRLCVVDIGLHRQKSQPTLKTTRLVEVERTGAVSEDWPVRLLPKMRASGHKYTFGHVIVFAGGVGRGGAARMAARSALRCGAGLVTIVCPKAAMLENAMQLDAVMVRGLDDAAGLDAVADERITGFCIGPGLGVGARTKEIVRRALQRGAERPHGRRPVVVLDADALTSFADDPQELFDLLHERCILTPHQGEFRRLFPDLAGPDAGSRSKIDVVRSAAERARCVVLLKGPDTVIAGPDGRASVHAAAYDRSVPWLATAGAGDVLAGLITGLAASPLSAALIDMTEVAAWLHVECALSFGPGLIAEDLPEEVPKVFRSLLR